MNTMPFVNQPLLPNQAHMCLYVSLNMCVKLGMLAEEMECLLVCMCPCFWGVMDESRTLPNILSLYICLNLWCHPKGPQRVCVCVCVSIG